MVGLASDVRMLRINFEGELGWELYHGLAYQQHLLDSIVTAGKEHGLKLVGHRALDGLRLEKSYASLWRELNGEYTAWESNLDRFIALDKGDFIGRDALVRQKARGIARRLVTLRIAAPEGAEALGNEEVYSGGTLVGRVTSAGRAYHLGFNIALAYVAAAQATLGTPLEVMVFNEKVPAEVIPRSPYDPKGERSHM